MDFRNGVKDIQVAGYNGACTVSQVPMTCRLMPQKYYMMPTPYLRVASKNNNCQPAAAQSKTI